MYKNSLLCYYSALMNIKKQIPILITVAIVLFGITAWRRMNRAQQASEPVTRPLIVGTNVGYPPFIITDENGHVTGFDFEVARAIAETLGRDLVVKDMAFDAVLLALRQGSVDMVIGGLSITQTRKKTGMMMPYYGDGAQSVAFFYPTNSTGKSLSLVGAAAQGAALCTQAGSLFEEIIEQYAGVRLKTLPDISDLYLEVINGNCVAGVLDVDTVRSLVQSSEGLSWHEVALPEAQQIGGFGVGVMPNNQPLRTQVEEAIAELRKNKAIKKLAKKWFS